MRRSKKNAQYTVTFLIQIIVFCPLGRVITKCLQILFFWLESESCREKHQATNFLRLFKATVIVLPKQYKGSIF